MGPSDLAYSWIPVFAPIAGGIAGAGLYVLIGF
jgi:glycerol uptake facilitator-like aquaporin